MEIMMLVWALLGALALAASTPERQSRHAVENPRNGSSALQQTNDDDDNDDSEGYIEAAASMITRLCAEALRDDVEQLTTLDQVDAFNRRHDMDVRLDHVNGTLALVRSDTETHIGTVAGDARLYVIEALGMDREDVEDTMVAAAAAARMAKVEEEGPCRSESRDCPHKKCVTVKGCAEGCHFCYPIVCI